jgi:glucan phosphorylase
LLTAWPDIEAQEAADRSFRDQRGWVKKSARFSLVLFCHRCILTRGAGILSTARMGKFSSDRCMKEYARDIWGVTVRASSVAVCATWWC